VDAEPPFVHGEAGERAAQIINVELGKGLAIVAICAALCGISVPIALWAGYQAQVMTTEYRVTTNHYMDMQAKQENLIHEVQELKDAKQRR
jgi:hypothetical protein